MQPSPSTKEHSANEASSQVPSRYLIKKALLNRAGSGCAGCYRKTVPVRLSRVHKNSRQPKGSDYILLCHDCIITRQEKRKEEKKRLWKRKLAKRKITRGGFWNKIRQKVFERDKFRCVWCGTEEKQKLGLGPLIPLSRGGKLEFDNYVTTCQFCRPSKGKQLPLEFIFQSIELDEFLHEEFDQRLRVIGDPGKYVKIRLYLFSEVSEFLHRLTSDPKIPSATRSRAELLNIKLLS